MKMAVGNTYRVLFNSVDGLKQNDIWDLIEMRPDKDEFRIKKDNEVRILSALTFSLFFTFHDSRLCPKCQCVCREVYMIYSSFLYCDSCKDDRNSIARDIADSQNSVPKNAEFPVLEPQTLFAYT